MAPVTYRSAFPIVYCDDLPRSLRFYRELLGFAITFAFPDQGEPGFVALALEDGSELALADVGDPEAVHLHGKAVRPSAGHRFELCVYASDVDAAVGELRAAGVPVLLEPVEQPWGERLAYVEDPEGNPVMICAPLTPER
jgi:lactoylglutathione lyase